MQVVGSRCDAVEQVDVLDEDMDVDVDDGSSTGDWHSATDEAAEDCLRRDNKERQRRIRKLLEWVESIEGKCVVCYVKWCHQGRAEGRQMTYEHEFRGCKVLGGSDTYMAWRRQIRFKEYSCCWTCGLPQA
ncbi:uncharacterized protein B0I36DRAFT_369638 [Microdochium trichocladiopsis]|uniref:Uncharacterized protein n=1 Tax=Microdochium trichocladiopsis TaxID=1682393 RepID=A0A9P8XR02_9PEZI|nr:uncharacterized protein B0I36DRAFT_369638 [Microdochium trichocladiopsis]KAH7012479.1 hypothetical protein B0I36DRAFT_369638 [Microdochium trichocladiopsis]